MTDTLQKLYDIEQYVYRVAGRKAPAPGVHEEWSDWDVEFCELYRVERLTKKFIFVYKTFECRSTFRLDRRALETRGIAYTNVLDDGAVFVVSMPKKYRKQTIGYLLDKEPLKVLGLEEGFTEQQLKDAFRKRAQETHPDRGGEAEDFRRVNMAYLQLKDGRDFRVVWNKIRDVVEKRACPECLSEDIKIVNPELAFCNHCGLFSGKGMGTDAENEAAISKS